MGHLKDGSLFSLNPPFPSVACLPLIFIDQMALPDPYIFMIPHEVGTDRALFLSAQFFFLAKTFNRSSFYFPTKNMSCFYCSSGLCL